MVGINDLPTENRQNVTVRHRVLITNKTTNDFKFSHDGNEKDEVGAIQWIPIKNIGEYQWAFNHDKLILKLASI